MFFVVLLLATLAVGYLAFCGWTIHTGFFSEYPSAVIGWMGVLLLVLGIALIGAVASGALAPSSQPCVRHETRSQYNPATKTVMPLQVCVERGEWVD